MLLKLLLHPEEHKNFKDMKNKRIISLNLIFHHLSPTKNKGQGFK